MSSFRPNRFHGSRVAIALIAFGSASWLQCSPERTLLITTDVPIGAGGSAASSVAGSAFAGSGGPDATGGGPLDGGDSDAGGASFGGSGGSSGASVALGGGASGGGNGGNGGNGGVLPCTAHADCPTGNVCVSNTCQPCTGAATACPSACSTGFSTQTVTRNGCAVCECVPPSTCTLDRDCSSDEVCYAGAQCQTGCRTPDCCFGNHCAAPGCGSTVGLNCGAVGCPLGGKCFSVCAAPTCACSASAWQCTGDGAAGSSSCAWVCTSP